MTTQNVRRGVTNARFNENAFAYIAIEILLFSIIVGAAFSSWWIFGGIFVGSVLCIYLPIVNWVFSVVASLFWCVFWGAIVCLFSGCDISFGDASTIWEHVDNIIGIFHHSGPLIVGLIAFLASLGLHIAAIEYGKDLGQE